MSRQYHECLHPVPGHGSAPVEFLDTLIDVIKSFPDEVFAPNSHSDIYGVLAPVLGPWTGLIHRRAAMCDALRCIGGFESGWRWTEGADTTAGPETPEEEETGIFQVSFNSVGFNSSLRDCVQQYCDSVHPGPFIANMKSNPKFAVEYATRLLRFNTKWDGPINRRWVSKAVWKPAVAEFQTFLA